MSPELATFTTAETARFLGVDPRTLIRWCDAGKVQCLQRAKRAQRQFDQIELRRRFGLPDDFSFDEALLRPGEVCAVLGVVGRTLVRWANSGKLKPILLPSGHRRYRESEVKVLLATRR